MKLDYNILWFEDNRSSFDVKKQIVKSIVDELGFHFPEPRNEIDGDNISTINYDTYDLIIVDLNLVGTKGTALIDKIRNNEGVYTEVIFYSSDGEKAVRNALKDYEIDGAYCADRNNDDFEEKVRKVIKNTVKKVQDLNNMRGLIMAETSDIDHTMFQIIQTVIQKDSFGIKDSLEAAIYKNVGSKVEEKKKTFDKYNGKRLDKIIGDPLMFDSHQKVKCIQYIIDFINHEITNPHKNQVFENNYTELKKKRDLLAHVIEVFEDGKKKLKSKNYEFEFTDEFCVEIRIKVKQHGKDLDDLLGLINSN